MLEKSKDQQDVAQDLERPFLTNSKKRFSTIQGDLDDFIFFGEEIKKCSER